MCNVRTPLIAILYVFLALLRPQLTLQAYPACRNFVVVVSILSQSETCETPSDAIRSVNHLAAMKTASIGSRCAPDSRFQTKTYTQTHVFFGSVMIHLIYMFYLKSLNGVLPMNWTHKCNCMPMLFIYLLISLCFWYLESFQIGWHWHLHKDSIWVYHFVYEFT